MRGTLVSALLLGLCLISASKNAFADSSRETRVACEPRARHHLKVRITSPGKHEPVDSGTIVRGFIEAPDDAEVGVTVNGRPAEVSGSHFAFSGLTPRTNESEDKEENEHSGTDDDERSPHSFRIMVKAVDDAGNKATDRIKVVAAEPFLVPAAFSSYPSAGLAPLAVQFALDAASLSAMTLYELDYEGDGVVDATSPTLDGLSSGLAHTYGVDGLFFPTLTATDRAGGKSARTIIVNVCRVPDLKKKWDAMNAALTDGDVAKAVMYFAESTRDSYRKAFSAMADAGVLAQAAAGMGDIAIVRTEWDNAEGDLLVIKNGREYSHPVLFVKDDDGIWRIRAF